MAVTFFWRCEAVSLDADHDHSAGDTTATLGAGVRLSAEGARYGHEGLEAFDIDASCSFTSTNIVSFSAGSIGFWFKWTGTWTEGEELFQCMGSDGFVKLYTAATSGRVRMSVRQDGYGTIDAIIAANSMVSDTWYFIVGRWDHALDLIRVEVYNSDLSLRASAETENTNPTPANDHTSFSFGAWETLVRLDNLFISDSYQEPIQDYATITSYTQYMATSHKSRMTLYWSGRGASIASEDFAVGGTIVEAYSSPTYDATAAMVGSLGGNHSSEVVDPQTRFYSDDEVLLTKQEGCFAAWVNWLATGAALYSQEYSNWTNNLAVSLNPLGAITFRFNEGTDNQSALDTADGVASLDTPYFVIVRWKSSMPYRRLEVYDSALQRVAYVESSASWTLPDYLGGRVTVGQSDGNARSYVDNVFLSTAWDAPMLENAKIDSFAQFEVPGERKVATQKYTHLLVR